MARILKSGDIIRSSAHEYRIEEYVGSGGQAHGYRTRSSRLADGPVFLKQYHEKPFVPRFDRDGAVKGVQERLVKRLESFTFVQKIFEFFEADSCYYQSGAWQEGVGLDKFISQPDSYSARERKIHAVSLCYAIRVLHDEQKIAHMDLSKLNVRIVEGAGARAQIHLTDFDNATIDGETPVVVAGTPNYIAPEKIDPERVAFRGVLGFASDVFSLTCLIYEILMGVTPWKKLDAANPLLYLRSRDTAYHPAQLSRYFGAEGPGHGRDLGRILWEGICPAAADRPTAKEIHEAFGALDLEEDADFPVLDPSAPLPFPAETRETGPDEVEEPPPPAVTRSDLVLRCGDRKIVIGETEVVGRDKLRGLDGYQTVSRKHARFFFVEGKGWHVTHVGSVNPTVVDGVEVATLARHPIKPGSVIRLGTLELEAESA